MSSSRRKKPGLSSRRSYQCFGSCGPLRQANSKPCVPEWPRQLPEAFRGSATGDAGAHEPDCWRAKLRSAVSGAVFEEVVERMLFVFARTEAVAGEIEERFALHLSIVASQITGLPVELVEVLPSSCGSAVSS